MYLFNVLAVLMAFSATPAVRGSPLPHDEGGNNVDIVKRIPCQPTAPQTATGAPPVENPAAPAAASPNKPNALLYVASTDGNITTLRLQGDGQAVSLESVSRFSDGCGPTPSNPSWLEFNAADRSLYCIDEAFVRPVGSVATFTVDKDGKLSTPLTVLNLTAAAPVHGVLYGENKKFMAIPNYEPPLLSRISNPGDHKIQLVEPAIDIPKMDQPGPNAERQNLPHPHQAVLDPTGAFILVPDLGADKVHVFAVDASTGGLTLKPDMSIKIDAGTGPRHAAFAKKGDKAFMYVVGELSNHVHAYTVTYPSAGAISFEHIGGKSTFPDAVPQKALAGEISVSPDGNFVVVSNRLDRSFNVTGFSVDSEASDSLATFRILDTGDIEFVSISPAFGLSPRHFSFNKDGSLLAVALPASQRVVVMQRDVQTGKLAEEKPLAFVNGLGAADTGPNCVVWEELV